MKENVLVSFLLVVRNEEKYIEQCLNSIVNQSFPKNHFEIIIVDNDSNDRTNEIINKIILENSDVNIKYIVNVGNTNLATGWNIAIKESNGIYVVRIDGHAYVPRDFLQKNIDTFKNMKDAVCVGGKITTLSKNNNKVIISVLTSPFGIGNSKFRYSSISGYVDTVPFGMYKKEIFDKVGYFNEGFDRAQDIEMHKRIRKAGGKFYFNPEIESFYYSKESLKKLLKMGFINGKWTMYNLLLDKKAVSVRHFVPFIFVLGLIIGGVFSIIFPYFIYLYMFSVFTYFILATLFSILKSKNPITIIKITITFFLLHLMYGLGSIYGIMSFR